MTNEILATAIAIKDKITVVDTLTTTVDNPGNNTPRRSLQAICDMHFALENQEDANTLSAINAQIDSFKIAILAALDTRANELAQDFDNLKTEQV